MRCLAFLSPYLSPVSNATIVSYRYPYVCTEILSLDSWQITETIFGNTGAYLGTQRGCLL